MVFVAIMPESAHLPPSGPMYHAKIKPETVLFELQGVEFETARRAMQLAMYKLPIKTKFIYRSSGDN